MIIRPEGRSRRRLEQPFTLRDSEDMPCHGQHAGRVDEKVAACSSEMSSGTGRACRCRV